MLRFRRYRIFWILAVFVIGALYHFRVFQETTIGEGNDVGGLRGFGFQREHDHEHKQDHRPAVTTAPEEVVSGPPELGPKEKDQEEETQKGEEKEEEKAEEKEDGKADEKEEEEKKEKVKEAEEEIPEKEGSELLHDSPSDLSKPAKPIAEKPSTSQPEKVADAAAADSNEENKTGSVIDGKLNASPTESSPPAVVDIPEEPGKGRVELPTESPMPKIYWSKLPEHFPIPSASIIQLPTGAPKPIPNIQHVFADESANDKIDREQKLVEIKKAFEFSWAGYKDRAWMKDELSPVSGGFRNPFCGWAATLVDSLDTLWIMDMKEEFEEAVNSVKDIDFTTTDRKDIPIFETVIRYLGGLLSAYDLSGVKYRVLLDKAVELAEVLMGAFDTPNRMPTGYYYWKPAFASQPHRARTRTVLAELGSLSVEFTRLAQLTKEPKYYDAVARITNELSVWQNNTKLPGLWPLKVDASGCKKPDASSTMNSQNSPSDDSRDTIPSSASQPILENDKAETGHIPEDDSHVGTNGGLVKSSANDAIGAPPQDATSSKSSSTADDRSRSKVANTKRQVGEEDATHNIKTVKNDANDTPVCEPQGLASPPGSSREVFSLGALADSAYEYLPKEYMLLGGLEDGYRRMYEMAMEAAQKYLLFRPMLPEERNVRLLGTLETSGHLDNSSDLVLQPEGTHLSCFAGGMFAIGAKIFNREGDMDIARRLTDGCVWAYETTPTGIMPERYLTVPCESQGQCEWNETLYLQTANTYLGPAQGHSDASKQTISDNKGSGSNEKPVAEGDQSRESEANTQSRNGADTKGLESKVVGVSETKETRVSKRQLADLGNEKVIEPGSTSARTRVSENVQEAISIEEGKSGKVEKAEGNISGVEQKTEEKDAEQKTKEEDAQQKTKEEHASEDHTGETSHPPPPTPTSQESRHDKVVYHILPIGMASISSSSYILRPEAIESVFIMYRITGDSYWREKGWAMFEAIRKYTTSKFGASGLEDVTSDTIVHLDVMESFWLAETLKYLYLLFSNPDLINLDDYVLNTEAHPFKRPK